MSSPERPGLSGNYIAGLIRAGLGPTEGLRAFQEAGGAIRRQTWFRAWGSVVQALAAAVEIPDLPLNRRPVASELARGGWRTRERYTYMAEIFVRDRETGSTYRTPFAVTSDRALTYGGALGQAIDAAGAGAEDYGEEVLGGFVYDVYDRELW